MSMPYMLLASMPKLQHMPGGPNSGTATPADPKVAKPADLALGFCQIQAGCKPYNSFGQAKDTAGNRPRGGKLGQMTGRRNAKLRNGLSDESLGFCAQGVSSPGAVLRLFHVCLSAMCGRALPK